MKFAIDAIRSFTRSSKASFLFRSWRKKEMVTSKQPPGKSCYDGNSCRPLSFPLEKKKSIHNYAFVSRKQYLGLSTLVVLLLAFTNASHIAEAKGEVGTLHQSNRNEKKLTYFESADKTIVTTTSAKIDRQFELPQVPNDNLRLDTINSFGYSHQGDEGGVLGGIRKEQNKAIKINALEIGTEPRTTTEDDQDEMIQHDQLFLINDNEKEQALPPLQNLEDRQLILRDVDNDGNPRKTLSPDHKNFIFNGGNFLMKKRNLQAAGPIILAIGTNQNLYTRATINSGWNHVHNSGYVIGVTVMKDGTILGIGRNNNLYTRATINSGWNHVHNSGSVIGVTVMKDGTILGIGTNQNLYTRATINSGWNHVHDSGSVIGVTVMKDGTILGIGTNNNLYTRATINSGWNHVHDSGSVIAVATFHQCPDINIPPSHGIVGKVTYSHSEHTVGTKATVWCPYNPLWSSDFLTTECKENGQWDKDAVHECRNQGDSDSDFRVLPNTFNGCPLLMYLSKKDCKKAGLSLGGKLRNGNGVVDGSWSHAPVGCSIQKSGDIHYNYCQGQNNGQLQPVCSKGSFTLLPIKIQGGCPSLMNISKEDCAAAGLSAGGNLRNGNLIEGHWNDVPFGCSMTHGSIYYNSDINGINNGHSASLCHELPFIKMNGLPKCPLESSVDKEECIVAGLSVGGILQNDELIVGVWNDKPSDCFLTEGANIIHFNSNPVGVRCNNCVSVCKEIEAEDYIVLPPKYDSRCPLSIKVAKDKCKAAGLAVGGVLQNDEKVVEGFWNNRSSGCFFGPEIHYNTNSNGVNSDDTLWYPICNKMEGVVEVPSDKNKCSSDKSVDKKDCIAAGLAVGGKQIGGLSFEGSWNDRPSGCYLEEFGSGLIYFNANANPSANKDNENVSLLCQWECVEPNSIQHPESLGCQCVHGYVSQETGEQLLNGDSDTCISALLSSFIATTHTTITYRSTIVTDMNDLTLTQRAPANDISINLSEKFSKSSLSKANGEIEYIYAFSGLDPGHRYKIRFSYVDAGGQEKDMRFPAVTSCSACGSDLDKTGSPTNFKSFQDNGQVMFSFEDCSVCEEAYSFTRTSYEDGNNKPTSFTRDYFFISMQTSGSVVNPVTEASDNLAKSKLIVGKDYKYCVRAVHPILYMDHPFDHEGVGRTLLSSSDTCNDYRIKWEASIHGKITTEPNAGSLPIKDVTVTYSLMNEDEESPIECDGCSGIQETTEGGSFDITFNVDNPNLYQKNTHEIPVKVTFSKSTSGNNDKTVEHQFLCNEGEDDCSEDIGIIVYLTHLQFREPLHVYDDTSVPFSGKISIANTQDCAITGVEVCLIHERNVGGVVKTNEKLVCGETDSEGTYSVPIIIGSRVDHIDVMYHNHTFERSLSSSFELGTVIEAGEYYHGIDFVDAAKARLVVDVVGGLCNKNLGTSTVLVKIVGCDWGGMQLTQTATRGLYNNVPAHLLEVQVIEIVDASKNKRHDSIWSFFQEPSPLERTIDLRSVGAADTALVEEEESLIGNSTTGITSKDKIKQDEKENLKAIKEEEEEDLELVRFQFDGKLEMEVSVSPDSLQCSNYDPSSVADYSFHVLDYMKYFTVRVDLKYEIIEDSVYCDIVDSELKLRVENQVGVDVDDFYNTIGDDNTKEALIKCKDGCLYDIGHEEDDEGNLSSANVIDWFVTGRPHIIEPFTKSMIFTIQGGTGDITHTADFVIEGYYSEGPGRSFALPTHKPIMILRDPPGGLSTAMYENVLTTMKLETSSTSTSIHNKFGFGLKTVVHAKSVLCLGGGFGAMALNCVEVIKSDIDMQLLDFEHNVGDTTKMNVDTKSNQFSTTWSYETSSDPWTAGRMSDVFVVPNLNVMYREVSVVEWDDDNCVVKTVNGDGKSLPIITTFNIEDTENQPALAFFSRYHVKKVKIPELEAAQENKESQKDNCGCTDNNPEKTCEYNEADGTEKTTSCSEIDNEIKSLLAGIAGWDTALNVEKNTFDMNTQDASKSINNWFSGVGVKNMNERNPVQITEQTSDLEPRSLPKESLKNEFVDDVANKPVKRIQFSGGGNLFSMTMDKEKVWNKVGLSCWEGCNNESETNIKGPALDASKFGVFGVGPEIEFSLLDLNIHVLHESTKETAETESTSIGFVLGDDDPQDEFVVDLFYDEQYGTVIFKTVAGQSKCPHETNTAVIEDPRLVITRRPSQNVFPEEDMVFELEISNLGVGDESQFVLYAQHRDNDGSLTLLLDGASFEGSREFTNILKDSTYKKTLVIQRGPLSYQYSSLDLVLESACEDSSSSVNDLTASTFDETKSVTRKLYNVQEDEQFLIKFVEPCPKVEWAGELNRNRHFVINTNSDDPENLQVIVFNPSHGQGKFHDMTFDRLENVFLYYREIGDLHWSNARTEIINDDGIADSQTIDFAAEYAYKEESNYGYSSLKWALANKVPEGTYEIRVDAECDQLGGAADMDVYSTPILSGIIDLTPPEQYGRALPLRESVLVGEEIAVVFTEPVRCEAFDLLITVDSIGVQMDRSDPPIQTVCDGRKVGFQIDPTKINVEDWIGMSFSVEMGKIKKANVESKSNIFDMNGNPIERNVKFEKTFANIDLNQTSTLFTVTLNNMNHCSDVKKQVCLYAIKEKITTLLILNSSDQKRIEVESVSKLSNGKSISAKIKILPAKGSGRMLRHSETSTSSHSVGLSKQLQSLIEKNLNTSRMLVGNNAALSNLNSMIVDVSDLKILPGNLDIQLVTTDPEMIEEEEELYQYASINSDTGMNQPIMGRVERQAMIEEIEKKERGMMNEMKEDSKSLKEAMMKESKSREEAMMSKIERMDKSQAELTILRFELMVVTLACIGISLIAFISLRRC